jgi:MFS family permease
VYVHLSSVPKWIGADIQFYTVGSIVASRAPTMPVLIGMRCLQAIGSSAVISVGAGSLADMYEVHERGQKVSLSLLSTTKTTQDE